MPNLVPIRRVTSAEERRLVEVLSRSLDENAYLLGLIQDYSVAELSRMQWGWFFWYLSQGAIEGVLYLDTTGLAVLSPSSQDSLAAFAEFVVSEELALSRIIAEETSARSFDQYLRGHGLVWQSIVQTFEEEGMALRSQDLAPIGEPDLRLAHLQEATAIAKGAAAAMLEELNLTTDEHEMDRLISSKIDLINRGRYFVFQEKGKIVFQAFLSTVLPQVALIQGVWVPKEYRKRGIATRCVAEICRRALGYSDRILLRVQKRNLPAMKAYRKVGFKPFLDYLSIWYKI